MIVCVGKLAGDWLKPGYKNPVKLPPAGYGYAGKPVKVVQILHPAYILRQNVAQQSFMVQQAVVTITSAAEDL